VVARLDPLTQQDAARVEESAIAAKRLKRRAARRAEAIAVFRPARAA
jgi:methyl-accepting chemotaxis protein